MYFEYHENNEMHVNTSKLDVKNKYVWRGFEGHISANMFKPKETTRKNYININSYA